MEAVAEARHLERVSQTVKRLTLRGGKDQELH